MELIGVVGAGTMGAGLAEVVATAGLRAVVRSRTPGGAEAVRRALHRALERAVSKGRLDDHLAAAAIARVTVTDRLADLADCDLVIESVVEEIDTKRRLFAELDVVVRPDAILATNTSTLPVVELAMATQRPDLVCGIHFFNPAAQMRLVEVVRPLTAADDTIKAAMAFATACGKEPIEVADRAGFVVNALLFPYLNSAVRLYEQGTASIGDIDAAMCGGCNFPLGPFALLDLVGLDTSVAILDALHRESGATAHLAAPTLRRMVAAGRLGRKSGAGFHQY